MRTYSHALLTLAAARRLAPGAAGAWAAAGAALPDLPALAGATWLFARRRRFSRAEFYEQACGRSVFAGPDAALHSTLPVCVLLAVWLAFVARGVHPRGRVPAFLLGWAGHVLADALTHAEDARPTFWPLSRRRFESPVSYWDPARHARLFSAVEHAALLLVAARMTCSRHVGTPGKG